MTAPVEYGDLLFDVKPEVVHADELNRQYIARLESLIVRNDLAPAEEKLVELLTVLIRAYEAQRYKAERATPLEIIRDLMEHRNLRNKDLVPVVFESESVASDVLRGHRDLTLKHIKRLAQFFALSPEVFIEPEHQGKRVTA